MKQFILILLIGIPLLTSCKERYYKGDVRVDTQHATIAPVITNSIVLQSIEISYNHRIQLIKLDDCKYVLYHGSSQGSGKAITHHAACNNPEHIKTEKP